MKGDLKINRGPFKDKSVFKIGTIFSEKTTQTHNKNKTHDDGEVIFRGYHRSF